jgi:hypothetical protein
VREVAEAGGLAGIRELALKADPSGEVGYAVGRIPDLAIDEEQILAELGSSDEALPNFAFGYVAARFRDSGWDWAEPALKNLEAPEGQAAFLLALPRADRTRIYNRRLPEFLYGSRLAT